MIHHTTSAPTDFGRGFVESRQGHAGYHNPSDYWGANRVTILDCKTGEAIRLTEVATDGSDEPIFDRSDDIAGLLDMAVATPASEMLAFLTQEAVERGIENETAVYDVEACGCRAFYPELRGNKAAYEASR